MNWIVLVAERARKELEKFPKPDRDRIFEVIKELQVNPYQGDIEKMEGEEFIWRRRVGSYRIFYELYPHKRIVNIFRVERRTSKTY